MIDISRVSKIEDLLMSTREQEIAKIAKMYTKYLNGPLGNGVMNHLQEGESFTIKSESKILEILKYEGKAIVKVIDSGIQTNQTERDHLKKVY
jgi:hypothetical protein